MIRHDMSRCILCTRPVRACDEIQQVGVLDAGDRGDGAQIIVGADGDSDRAGCTWCGECAGDTLQLVSRRGAILIGARLSPRQARGQLLVPFHFREAAANLLTNPALDPCVKIASFKVSAVRVERG
ncbi:MAG: molybdopterin dinucleotide binding domain-containing protein [Gemmatimonadales bacterium]